MLDFGIKLVWGQTLLIIHGGCRETDNKLHTRESHIPKVFAQGGLIIYTMALTYAIIITAMRTKHRNIYTSTSYHYK